MSDEEIRMEILNIVGAVRDYPHDLNAMAEARATLSASERIEYENVLCTIVCPKTAEHYTLLWPMLDANANQHAEAFLRVKGLWKEADGV